MTGIQLSPPTGGECIHHLSPLALWCHVSIVHVHAEFRHFDNKTLIVFYYPILVSPSLPELPVCAFCRFIFFFEYSNILFSVFSSGYGPPLPTVALVSAWGILIPRRPAVTLTFIAAGSDAPLPTPPTTLDPQTRVSRLCSARRIGRANTSTGSQRRTVGRKRRPGIRRRVFHPDPLVIHSELHRWIHRISC